MNYRRLFPLVLLLVMLLQGACGGGGAAGEDTSTAADVDHEQDAIDVVSDTGGEDPGLDAVADPVEDPSSDPMDVADITDGVDAPDSSDLLADPVDSDVLADLPTEELVTLCSIFTPGVVETATVDDLYDLIVAGETLAVVDVREPAEQASGVIDGAYLMPWSSGVLEDQHATLPDDRPLYVICASRSRSTVASSWLSSNGHDCVVNVSGGMNAWNAADYPTVTP